MDIERPVRVFLLGVKRLADPAPELPPEEAVRLYARNFPVIAHSTLGAPTVEGEELAYPIELPPVKTKG